MMLSGDTDEVDENLTSWKIVLVESQIIGIELEFESAIQVSQGE